MNHLGPDLFTCSGFTRNEHRALYFGCTLGMLAHASYRWMFTEYVLPTFKDRGFGGGSLQGFGTQSVLHKSLLSMTRSESAAAVNFLVIEFQQLPTATDEDEHPPLFRTLQISVDYTQRFC